MYLRACLDEAMRISPPIPGVLWCETLVGGVRCDNSEEADHAPAGLDVGTGIYGIHHHRLYFLELVAYKPTR